MATNGQLATRIVNSIIRDIEDRSGLDNEWDQIESGIKTEIRLRQQGQPFQPLAPELERTDPCDCGHSYANHWWSWRGMFGGCSLCPCWLNTR